MPRFPSFIGSSFTSQSVIADAELTINKYVERVQSDSQHQAQSLITTPGFNVWASVGVVGYRAMRVANGRLFAVIAGSLYEFTSAKVATFRGNVTQDANPATISFNGLVGNQLFITSGGNGYNFDLGSNTLTQVLTAEATMGAFANGRFLALNVANGHVRYSALNDGSVTGWAGAGYFSRGFQADPLQAMFVDGQSLIWLVGTESYEGWYVTTDANNPYAALSGLVGRYGIAAPFSWALAGDGVYWLSQNVEGVGEIIRAQSGGQVVSNYGVSNVIATFARDYGISDAEAIVHRERGHTFAVWTFPRATSTMYPPTWALDVDTGSWCARGKWNSAQGRYEPWTPRAHAYAFGLNLIGDRASGAIAQMDSSYATELDGSGVRWLRRCPGYTKEHQQQPYDNLELLMDVGLGTQTGQGVDPQVMLRYSGDGGRTFGNEHQSGVGRVGQFGRRVYWNRLGILSNAVFEVTGSDPVPMTITDAWVNSLSARAA